MRKIVLLLSKIIFSKLFKETKIVKSTQQHFFSGFRNLYFSDLPNAGYGVRVSQQVQK